MLSIVVLLGKYKLERMSKRGVTIFSILATFIVSGFFFSSRALELTNILQCIIAIYRLSVMPTRVTSLTESRLNRPGEKAAFYIFHVLPEWLATVVLFVDNIRKTFGTGLAGDWRLKDETEKEKEKRMASEEKRKTKRLAEKGNGGTAELFEKDTSGGLRA